MLRRDDNRLLFLCLRRFSFFGKVALSLQYRLKGELSLLSVNGKYSASNAISRQQHRGGDEEKDEEENVYAYVQHGSAWKKGVFSFYVFTVME